jgi:hypothetical protein
VRSKHDVTGAHVAGTAVEIGGRHLAVRAEMGEIDHARVTDPLVDRHRRDVAPVDQKVQRRIDVRVGVAADGQERALQGMALGVRGLRSCGATFQRKCGRIEKLRSTTRMGSAVGDHHGDREPVVDLAVHQPRLDAQGVVGQGGPEERADLSSSPGFGNERAISASISLSRRYQVRRGSGSPAFA